MTRNGIYKMARVQKKADGLCDSAAFLGTLVALGITIPSFGAGWVLGKTTAPRDTDIGNLQKQYRLARLQNDKRQLLTRQAQINSKLSAAPDDKKSVYGLVNS